MKETSVQQRIRLCAAQSGNDLWRNNTGALLDQYGRLVRFGLCNDSEKLNKRIKSSDLIGPTPTIITQEMVGRVIGIFTAVETKKSDWFWTPSDERAVAQAAFHDIVRRAGGYAGFARNNEEYRKIIGL